MSHGVHANFESLEGTVTTDIFLTSSPVSGAADISAGFDLIITND